MTRFIDRKEAFTEFGITIANNKVGDRFTNKNETDGSCKINAVGIDFDEEYVAGNCD